VTPEPEAREADDRPDERVATRAERIAAGWQRRFVVDPSRVVDMVRLYQELGYETAVDPIRPEDLPSDEMAGEASDRVDPRCGDCRLVTMRWLHVIYTRPARPTRAR